MKTLGRHLLVELRGCDGVRLNDVAELRRVLLAVATAAGATPVAEVFHPFAPHGVTGVVVIEESHLSVHTWPEIGYAAVDFYTCGEARIDDAISLLADGLAATSVEMLEVVRGLDAPAAALRVERAGAVLRSGRP